MSKLQPSDTDTAPRVEGTFTATGAAATRLAVAGCFNVVLSGTWSATVAVEYSFDGGTTWVPAVTLDGVAATYSAPGAYPGEQPEGNTLVRLNCTAYTSGTVAWRISR